MRTPTESEIKVTQMLSETYLLAIANEPAGIPNGHLYATVAMTLDATLDQHAAAVAAIKSIGMVNEEHFLLTWCGPEDIRAKLKSAMAKALAK